MDREQEIRLIAYHLWEDEGRTHGCDVRHWLVAERIWEERSPVAQTVRVQAVSVRTGEKRKRAVVRRKTKGGK